MFKDNFIKELSKITPDDGTKNYVLRQMNEVQKGQTKVKTRYRFTKKTRSFKAAVATVLCICIIALSTWIAAPSVNSGIITSSVSEGVPANVTYSGIYNLFSSIYKVQEAPKNVWDVIEKFFGLNFSLSAAPFGCGAADGSADFSKDVTEDITDAETSSTVLEDTEDYSTTNRQVNDVDEADIIKTDGKYIYTLNNENDMVYITRADKGKLKDAVMFSASMTEAASINYSQVEEMYVSSDRLIVIGTDSSDYDNTVTKSLIYDISDPENPKFKKSFAQSGNYISSRLVGDVLYMFTDKAFYDKPIEDDVSTYIPMLYETAAPDCPIPENNIFLFSGEIDRSYLIVTSVDCKEAKRIDSKTTLGGGDTVYANTESVYVAAKETSYHYLTDSILLEKYRDTTRLIRFGIDKDKLTAAAEGAVRGEILNQFSMDEHNGYFRIVTTVAGRITEGESTKKSFASTLSETTNALFVLDRDLKQVGSIVNLAPDERVYSVRFIGDYGYFVTYREVDPLFSVDISDPKSPKLLSALKIPGFSEYLHPYDDGLLLGIGKEDNYVKLSMFDISDPSMVLEKDKLICYSSSYSTASNHKAVLVNKEKNIIGFAGSDDYFIYSYDKEKGFVQRAKLPYVIKNEQNPDYSLSYSDVENTRGLYIGDYFYLCNLRGITSYSIDDFELVTQYSF